jgi:hypothetical protein
MIRSDETSALLDAVFRPVYNYLAVALPLMRADHADPFSPPSEYPVLCVPGMHIPNYRLMIPCLMGTTEQEEP